MSVANGPAGEPGPGTGEAPPTNNQPANDPPPNDPPANDLPPNDPPPNDPPPADGHDITEPVDADLLVGDVVDPDEPVGSAGAVDSSSLDREELQHVTEAALAERNEYLEALRRLQAEFENFRKRSQRQQAEAGDRATERLVTNLLPVFDSVDLARAHGTGEIDPIGAQLLAVMKKEGLERVDPTGEAFDPNHHEAVMHAEGEGTSGPVVAETFRAGWRWKGRVIRPAMVRVEG